MLGRMLDFASAAVETAATVVSTARAEAVQIGRLAAEETRSPHVSITPGENGEPAGRAHVAVRGADQPVNQDALRRLERALAAGEGIHGAELNGVLGRVLLRYEPERWDRPALARLISRAEQDCGLADHPHASSTRIHPAHPEALLRAAWGFGLSMAGLGVTTAVRVLPVPPLGVLPAVLSLVDVVPKLRAVIEAGIGESAADVLLSTAAAVSHTAARQPLALVVDACQRYCHYQEASARRQAWWDWDRSLAARDGSHRAAPATVPTRPCPLPDGPVERAAHRSALAATAAAGVAQLGAARARTGAVLAAGVPKATRTAREGFATQLGRDICADGCLVLDPAGLRRLDRVDAVLLDATLLFTGRQIVDEVVPVAPGLDAAELLSTAYDLLDTHAPRRTRRGGGWVLAPLPETDVPVTVRRLAEEHAEPDSTLLLLRRGTRPVALVKITSELEPFAEALVASAGRAGPVYLHGRSGKASRLGTWTHDGEQLVDELAPDAGLSEAVDQLQREGHVVALVSREGNAELAAADLGVGVLGAGRPPPWAAHVLCRSTAQVCAVLDAVPLARRASGHGVRLSLAGSAFGGLVAVLGPASGAARRVAIPVQTAALLGLGAGVWAAMSAARLPAPVPTRRSTWHAMSAPAVLASLDSAATGLTEAEATQRRHSRLADSPDTRAGLGRATMEELATPLTPALATGAGLSASTGSVLDPLLITAVLLVNALIGGAQQLAAQRELGRLTAHSAPEVSVRRVGRDTPPHDHDPVTRATRLPADELVHGDVVELRAGDSVPADCRVIDAQGLEMDESTLTGESTTVPKSPSPSAAHSVADRTSMLYEGTVVATGNAVAVVVATGADTEIGHTRRISAGAAPLTGVETRLRALTSTVLPYCVIAGLTLAAVDVLRGRGLGQTLGRAVGLAVAAVPEGLPVVATVAELAAARRLSKRGTLVRNPATIEALGRVQVLCFDKTGTLTEGRLALHQVSDRTSHAVLDDLTPRLRGILAAALRASPFATDPQLVPHQTDRAVLIGAARAGVTPELGQSRVDLLAELPFESNRAYYATLWHGSDGNHISAKGAPEVVLPLCRHERVEGRRAPLDDAARARLDAEVDRLARQGYRVLAVAERPSPGRTELDDQEVAELTFLGLLALTDPVRPTAAQAVATLREAGVEVKMLTGDHPSTAESIAAELDAVNGRKIVTGAELDGLDDEQLDTVLPDVAVFARVTPEHKARIVRRLRAGGLAVAVTGDGANDAPAIRLADVGLALGERATPAAREAADVVITDNRIETITDAIVEGRAMWSSVRDALSILLGGNLGEIAYTVGTGLLDGGEALNARQLLLVNMLTDVLPAMAVAVRPPPDITARELLAEGPEASLGTALTRDITSRATITALSAAAAWMLARPMSSPGQGSTTGLVALVGAQLGQTLAIRGRTPLVAAAAAGSLLLLAAIVQTPGISHIAGCRPLLLHQWAIALTAATVAALVQLVAPAAAQLVISRLPALHSLLASSSPSSA